MIQDGSECLDDLGGVFKNREMKRAFEIGVWIFLFMLGAGCAGVERPRGVAGPWDVKNLEKAPAAAWGVTSGLTQEVYYDGEPFNAKATRVFAYVGRPEGPGKFPGIVLIHGGGGRAFKDWAEHWARRGYVSIAMDLSGNGPNGRLADGGPDQSDKTKFRDFTAGEEREMWSYHAVAAAVRAHSLLLSLPEVDRDRTAVTGISWGGYLTCIVAGIDHRFKAAVPVYGCGFLGDNSCWRDTSLARMSPEARALWIEKFDPSNYLTGVRCPILFLNGTHDFAYPLDSYQRSYRLVKPGARHLSVAMKLPHGHIWTFREVDEFVDRALAGKKFPKMAEIEIEDGLAKVRATEELKEAELCYTTDQGPWDKREWKTVAATVKGREATVELKDLPNAGVLMMTGRTGDGLRVSSEWREREKARD